ncbi:hypothetical protein SARC_02503 [Sphaeroforma arctica JP610]|uniref:Uncharacterized protein n=1 Tax=Sphaeroforma arctica JP610 TaxID=667725 RepID=A0A0L0G8W4_9EUKA|nr:hypothetical protein SARC_02503 [Sphaeroforma arctica JP610]KNC85321.1 hypothetical protein SARC_02503 [Sphaeroforma arctica JP610]|eukprot:XP_014159223.1 hypothetical protein SARC_02503 [Sphaeroforma arctica JP610]
MCRRMSSVMEESTVGGGGGLPSAVDFEGANKLRRWLEVESGVSKSGRGSPRSAAVVIIRRSLSKASCLLRISVRRLGLALLSEGLDGHLRYQPSIGFTNEYFNGWVAGTEEVDVDDRYIVEFGDVL